MEETSTAFEYCTSRENRRALYTLYYEGNIFTFGKYVIGCIMECFWREGSITEMLD